jgi:hypothetical protein
MAGHNTRRFFAEGLVFFASLNQKAIGNQNNTLFEYLCGVEGLLARVRHAC